MFRFPEKLSPLAVTALLILALGVWYASMLGTGSVHHRDEFLTLDRSASFLRLGDWLTVYANNAPTFKKPPLQYWAIAGLMAQGIDLEVALRLPSFLFGLGLLVVTAWLAHIAMPENRWAMPASVLLLACSERFWEICLSALLDTGATFFATLALAATLAAIRRPQLWWLVAAACGMGALQKAPTPLLFSAVPLAVLAATGRWSGVVVGDSLRSRHFIAALTFALILVVAWPTL